MQWDELRGNVRERFCEKCQHTVVNVSLLTPAERDALLAKAQTERVCIAYRQRLAANAEEPEAAGCRGSVSRGTLARMGGAAAFLAAVAALGVQANRDPRAGERAWENVQEAYYVTRYTVEDWLDEVRVFFGGTPRHTFVLGMVCEPTPMPAPTAPPPKP